MEILFIIMATAIFLSLGILWKASNTENTVIKISMFLLTAYGFLLIVQHNTVVSIEENATKILIMKG